jgi:hypothetical protein
MLTLPEELLLLSLDDKGHTHNVTPANLDTGLLAAAVYELHLRGRVAIEPEGVKVVDASPSGDSLLDETLKVLGTRPAGESFEDLLEAQHGHLAWLREKVKEGLCAKGELRQEENRLLWLLPQKEYAVEHGAEEMSLVERVTRALLLDEPADRRTSALLTLTASCYASDAHLRQRLFDPMRDRMYEIVNSGGEVQGVVRDSVCATLANTLPVFMP